MSSSPIPRQINGGLSRTQNNQSTLGNSTNRSLMQTNGYPSKVVLEDLVTSQGTLRRELMRNDDTVQAVRQENIMLAEKVQHATQLYRQLLGKCTFNIFLARDVRNSLRSCSVKKSVIKNFASFTRKHLCWSLFLIKLQSWSPAFLLKRDSNRAIFL